MSYQLNLRFLPFTSKLLRGNPMANSSQRVVPVLLPPRYSESHKYPTIWMLAGYFGNGMDLLKDPGPIGTPFARYLLDLQEKRTIPEAIFIFPDASTHLGGSQYIDSEACGPFMSHLVDELIPFVESQFSTVNNKNGRVITGHSSGGFGSLVTCMLRPDVFGYCIASAADSLFEYSCKSAFPAAASLLKKTGGVDKFLDAFFASTSPERCSKTQFDTLMTIAMASCYSPKPGNNTAHCELPFDVNSLEIKKDVWEKWLAWDPINLAKENISALKKLNHLHLDCGSEDEYGAQFGHRRLSKLLSENGVKHIHSEFPGGHSGTNYRYKFRFEELGKAIVESMWLKEH